MCCGATATAASAFMLPSLPPLSVGGFVSYVRACGSADREHSTGPVPGPQKHLVGALVRFFPPRAPRWRSMKLRQRERNDQGGGRKNVRSERTFSSVAIL